MVMSLLEERFFKFEMFWFPITPSSDGDRPLGRLDHPEESQAQTGLAGPSATNDANLKKFALFASKCVHLFVVQDNQVEVLQDTRQFRSVLGGISDTGQFAQK